MFKIYGKPACVYCEAAKRELGKAGLDYEYVDISVDGDERQKVIDAGFKTVPMVTRGGDLVGGFQELKVYLKGESVWEGGTGVLSN